MAAVTNKKLSQNNDMLTASRIDYPNSPRV